MVLCEELCYDNYVKNKYAKILENCFDKVVYCEKQ